MVWYIFFTKLRLTLVDPTGFIDASDTVQLSCLQY